MCKCTACCLFCWLYSVCCSVPFSLCKSPKESQLPIATSLWLSVYQFICLLKSAAGICLFVFVLFAVLQKSGKAVPMPGVVTVVDTSRIGGGEVRMCRLENNLTSRAVTQKPLFLNILASHILVLRSGRWSWRYWHCGSFPCMCRRTNLSTGVWYQVL